MLALTFVNPTDYDLIRQDDQIDILGLDEMSPGQNLSVVLHHADGTSDSFEVSHTYTSFRSNG